ncbi:hypothetical protein [Pseudoneobacillus rhizosphaerae]|uniref:Uncharacterized protein n=1 Tax=Pseudoneobacillus rhizosphaerae TaxID=2880968 RepID=A0A9C7G634_9BACI|nr:hypothetical protein [Pseudoneobacillus rhizosphaerae]CAG9606574.1 hypothetical protein NEOCIP111885_00262 [Pseudoneobacillus rhizosphaerae]
MKEVTYQKNLITSSLLNEALENQINRLFGNEMGKARLAYVLLHDKKKQETYETMNECVNSVKRNISSGNYRNALGLLVVLKKEIDEFRV